MWTSPRIVPPSLGSVNLTLDTEKWDGFGPALSVAVSGPGENLKEILTPHQRLPTILGAISKRGGERCDSSD